jgi:predicted secreted acid phosphatase
MPSRPKLRRSAWLILVALLTACSASSESSSFITVKSQPANVGDAKIVALAYHDSGAYARDLAIVAGRASSWIRERAAGVIRPALVLDIDETALSNWEIIRLDDFGRTIAGPCKPGLGAPCGWSAWDQLGRDPAIEPTLEVFRAARAANVTVFFITGRPEDQRAATERNLRNAGFGGYPDCIWFQPAHTSLPLRISRRRSAPKSNGQGTLSSPTWAISPRI